MLPMRCTCSHAQCKMPPARAPARPGLATMALDAAQEACKAAPCRRHHAPLLCPRQQYSPWPPSRNRPAAPLPRALAPARAAPARRRASNKSCKESYNDPCDAYEGDSGCSGFDYLWLVGTNGQGPYRVVVTSRDREAGSFAFGALTSEQ